MKSSLKKYINPDSLHHAHLIQGDRDTILTEIVSFAETELGMLTSGNPDFVIYTYNSLSIDDARSLQNIHILKPVKYDKKIIVVAFNGISHGAQNSLLKMFEEPSGNTVFFII
ncbi:MAG: hypothetical protein WCW14_00445, partial [Candidatus Paceibacterota bacterium]